MIELSIISYVSLSVVLSIWVYYDVKSDHKFRAFARKWSILTLLMWPVLAIIAATLALYQYYTMKT